MNYSHFIGLDLGKVSFDATILTKEAAQVSHSQFDNTPKGMVQLIKWLKSLKVDLSTTLFCAENMGSYASHLCLYCSKKELHLSLACPLKGQWGSLAAKTIRSILIALTNLLFPIIVN